MKPINTDQFKTIAATLKREDLKARRKLASKIYNLYSPFLRACPNVAGNKKMVCIIDKKLILLLILK